MFTIPSPLHPVIVHFPIVLILIGTAVAAAAVFIRRWHLPWLAAGMLAAGALGSIAATWTGENEGEMAGKLPPQADQILEQHEEWGERARNFALVAALLAVAAASTARFPKAAFSLGIVAALVAVTASYAVVECGHYGGQLVYKHGVGINTSAGSKPGTTAPNQGARKPQPKDD